MESSRGSKAVIPAQWSSMMLSTVGVVSVYSGVTDSIPTGRGSRGRDWSRFLGWLWLWLWLWGWCWFLLDFLDGWSWSWGLGSRRRWRWCLSCRWRWWGSRSGSWWRRWTISVSHLVWRNKYHHAYGGGAEVVVTTATAEEVVVLDLEDVVLTFAASGATMTVLTVRTVSGS